MHKIQYLLPLFFTLLQPLQSIYTNYQASECFDFAINTKCSEFVSPCVTDPDCQAEMSSFQGCSFGGAEGIFNGYCFRKWSQKARKTKQIINCLMHECKMNYNSIIGFKQLNQCFDGLLDQWNADDCDDDCVQAINQFRDRFYEEELSILFQQKIQNKQGRKIIKAARGKCLKPSATEQQPVETEEIEL